MDNIDSFPCLFGYKDIVLLPNYSSFPSRQMCSTYCNLGSRVFNVPICPANMTCTINTELSFWLSENDYFYAMHRFDGPTNKKDLKWFLELSNKENWKTISISIGVKDEDLRLLEWAKTEKLCIDFITVDIAYGNSVLMKEMLTFIRKSFGDKVFVIAGNVSTTDGFANIV
jgi:GMP reductase